MCRYVERRDLMKFKIFKMNFTGAVHFGEGGLTTSGDTLMADTIFAALCTEAAMQGGSLLDKLVESASSGKLLISDALPYTGKTLYLPKPVIEVRGRDEGNSAIKKALKKLRFIPAEKMDIYLRGDLNIAEEARSFHDNFSCQDLIEKVTVPEDEITRPYAVAVRRFRKGSGLYLCVGYDIEETCDMFSELFENLSYSGIGGKRSSGYGRFEVTVSGGGEVLMQKLQNMNAKKYMSLSVSLPAEDEMDDVISGADYLTVKRSGWVGSVSYSDTMRKKKDLYMLAAGSVFSRRFSGDIFDVGDGGKHPVYRYGKPMFMAIS